MSLVSSLVEARWEAMESTEAEEVWAPTKPVRLWWVDLQGEVVLGWGDTTLFNGFIKQQAWLIGGIWGDITIDYIYLINGFIKQQASLGGISL
jgi:hypothetical protein